VTVSSDQFVVTSDGCGGKTLKPGETCTITLAFRPTSVGDKAGLVTLSIQDPCPGNTVSAQLSGSGIATPPPSGPARVFVSPSVVLFDWYDLHCPIRPSRTVHVGNRGTTTTGQLSVAVGGPFTVTDDTCSGVSLTSGTTCDVVVRFDPPPFPTEAHGALTVKAAPGDAAQASLSAGAVYGATLGPGSHDYGPAKVGTAGGSWNYRFAVVSVGTPVTVTSVSTSLPDFVILADDCTGRLVSRGGECAIVVVFKPAEMGQRAGVLTVRYHQDLCGDLSLQADLSGVAQP